MVDGPTSEVDGWVEVWVVPIRRTEKTRMHASSPAQMRPTVRILITDLTDNSLVEPAFRFS